MSESIPSRAVGSGSSIVSSKNIAYDPETPPESSKVLMQVIDALYDGTKPQLRRERTEFDLTESRSLSTDSEFNNESAKFINNLPAQKPGTARIFDLIVPSRVGITGLKYAEDAGAAHPPEKTSSKDQNDKSRGHILQLDENRAFEWSKVPVEVNDIGSISAQWSQSLDSKKHVYRLVNCTSLKQHPRNTYLTCVRGSDDRLIVVIVNEGWVDHSRWVSRLLGEESLISLSDGSSETFSKLLVLDFFLASVYLQPVNFHGSLSNAEVPDKATIQPSLAKDSRLQVPLGLVKPRLSTNIISAVEEMKNAEDIVRSVTDVVEPIQYVTETIERDDDPGKIWPQRRNCMRRMDKLRGLCHERSRNSQRNLEGLSRQLDYLAKENEIRETELVKILTILASIYLPLSLSASLLGMQYPFKLVAHDYVQEGDDRYLVGTNLLFDFFGISLGLGTVTVFIFWTIRFALWFRVKGLKLLADKLLGRHSKFLYGRQWDNQDRQHKDRGTQFFGFLYRLTRLWIGAGFLLTLPAVFLVGMLGSAQVAWNVAKWTFTAYVAGGGALVVGLLCTYRCFCYTPVQN